MRSGFIKDGMPPLTVGESGNIEEAFGWGEGPGNVTGARARHSAPGCAGGHQIGDALFEGIEAFIQVDLALVDGLFEHPGGGHQV